MHASGNLSFCQWKPWPIYLIKNKLFLFACLWKIHVRGCRKHALLKMFPSTKSKYFAILCIYIYLSIYLSVCLSVCLSIYLSIYRSIYLSICVCACIYVYIYICDMYVVYHRFSVMISIYIYIINIYIFIYIYIYIVLF